MERKLNSQERKHLRALPRKEREGRRVREGRKAVLSHDDGYGYAEKANGDSIALFLIALRKRHSERCLISLTWGNAAYHRDTSIQEFSKKLGIKIHYLPPYSPNFNPIDRMWKLAGENVMYNTYHARFLEFTKATLKWLKDILRSRITDDFQILTHLFSHLEV